MTYRHLDEAFPWVLTARPSYIRTMVDKLFDPSRVDVPNGSSFAVTVDASNGNWRLWVSDASYRYLKRRYEVEHYAFWNSLDKQTTSQP